MSKIFITTKMSKSLLKKVFSSSMIANLFEHFLAFDSFLVNKISFKRSGFMIIIFNI